jgi:hypothetical protein
MITAKNQKNQAVAESIDFKRNAFLVEKKRISEERLLSKIPFFGIWGHASLLPKIPFFGIWGQTSLLPQILFFGIWGRLGGGLFTVPDAKFNFLSN